MKQKNKAFTLTEMAIVISIIAILLGIAIPNIISMKKKAEVDRAINILASLLRETYDKTNQALLSDGYYIEIIVNNNKVQQINFIDFTDGTKKVVKTFDVNNLVIKIYENDTQLLPTSNYKVIYLTYTKYGILYGTFANNAFNDVTSIISTSLTSKINYYSNKDIKIELAYSDKKKTLIMPIASPGRVEIK
ncbi:prepilin-type N-terminal cleavage/methylation domain-containing protein [Caldicellulosiruptoraceae bacterium PP1]